MKKPHDINSKPLRTSSEGGSATNDRLQSVEASDLSKTDLLALNERLTAENALLRRKLEEQNQAHRHMENMIASAGDASLFADRRLDIQGFIESEQRLRLFIEHAPAALAMFDTEMRYLCVSRRWMRDYRLGERDLTGESHYDVFPEVSVEWREAHRRGLAGEVLRAEGDRFEREDGSVQWVRWEIRPWVDAGGEIGGIVIFAEDITNIKAAEETLRRYQLLATHSRDIFLIIRFADGRIMDANSAAESSYGYRRDELLGLTIFDLRPAETVESTVAQMTEADTAGIIFETVHRRRDGSTFPVEVSSQGASIGSTRTLVSVVRDITERKRVDDALQASRAKFFTMFQTLPIAIALAAMPGGELYDVNPAWLELAGFASREEVIGKTSLELGLIGNEAQRESILKEFSRHGSVRNAEQSIVSRGGVPRILLVSLDSVEIGGRSYILSAMADITERKRAEESLLKSEERYRSLVESARFAIFINRDNRIEYANPAALKLFGAENINDVVGRSPYDFVHPDLHAAMSEWIKILLHGGTVPLTETRILRENGDERCVEVTAVTFIDHRGSAIQVMMHDVTERKRVAKALQESEEQFRTLADAIPQLCWMAHPDGWIFWYNQRWFDYTGTIAEQMAGWGWQSVHDPAVLPTVLERWQASIATGEPFDMAYPLRRADGAFRPFLTRVLPLKDSSGQVLRWFGTNTDISDLKQAEAALIESEEQFRTFANAIPQLCWMAKGDGWIFWLNQRCYDFTGRVAEELEGWAWQSVLNPDQLPEVLERWQASIASGESFEMEFLLRGKDGMSRPFLTRVLPLKNSSGGVLRWFGTCTDIFDLKQAEASSRESEERLRFALETCHIGAWDIDLVDSTAYRSLEHDRIFGYPKLLPQWTLDMFLQHALPEYRAEFEAIVREAAAARTGWTYQCRIRRVDGEIRWIWFSGRYSTDTSGRSRVAGVVQDITDRKEAEDALRESESRYSALFANKINGIAHCRVITDENGFPVDYRILQINEAYERIIGICKTDIEGRRAREVFPDIESYAFDYIGVYGKIALEGGEIKFEEFFEATGQYLSIYAYSPLPGEFAAIFTDITERKQAEDELLRKNLALESVSIELSLAEERERDRIATELHDQVGQRLILGKMKLDALASQVQPDGCLHDVEALGRILEHSIQDIRSLTFQLRPPLLASAGLEAALRWLGEEFQDTYGLTLIFSDDGQLKPMRYEVRSIVFQAAREMLLNTVKHAGATHFGITVSRHGCVLQLCLSDNGCGFDVAAARTKKAKSGGFGLINAQRRIDHLGGSLLIDSRPGDGTRITITTPLDLSHPNAKGYL